MDGGGGQIRLNVNVIHDVLTALGQCGIADQAIGAGGMQPF
jgi:hypothetical protein